METTYLPGTIRERIQDLMKERKVTQSQLAASIGTTASTLNRFLSGKTDKLGDESIIRIARVFNVSTDFLLGVTDIPDKMNFDIGELGISAQAARNLYTHKVNPNVVNRLLENPRFAEVTYMIDQYLNDTLASGFAAQNQMYSTLSTMLLGTVKTDAAVQAARDVNRLRVPVYQADLTNIQNQFMAAVKEVKKEFGSDISAYQALTKEMTANMFTKLTKGQDMRHPHVTPGQVASAITGSVAGLDGVNQKDLENLNAALQQFFESTLTPKERSHAESQQ